MTDLRADADRSTDAHIDTEPERSPGIPRWVKLLTIAGVVAVVLVVIVILLAGGQHGPGMHMPGGATPGGQTSPAAGTEAVSPSGSGLGAVGGPASRDQASRTVEVTTLDAMAFEPTSIDLVAGETVTFVVTNAGQAVHEFTIGDAAMQQEHADAMAHMPDGMAHDLPNSITLEPGETKELTWRFGVAGTLEYACHEPGHYAAGMRGQITVS